MAEDEVQLAPPDVAEYVAQPPPIVSHDEIMYDPVMGMQRDVASLVARVAATESLLNDLTRNLEALARSTPRTSSGVSLINLVEEIRNAVRDED